MNTVKPLKIVVASDNHYIILLAALIKSIEENIRKGQIIQVYIIEDNVSVTSQKKLQRSINPAITNLVWKGMNEVIPKINLIFCLNLFIK